MSNACGVRRDGEPIIVESKLFLETAGVSAAAPETACYASG
jgi:hypothetical protein